MYKHQLATNEEFTKICAPLLQLGIKNFCYSRFTQDRWIMSSTNLAYLKARLELHNPKANIFENTVIPQLQSGNYYHMYISDKIENINSKDDPILHTAFNYNMWNIFTVYRRNLDDSVDIYSFSGEHSDELLPYFCSNNINLLKRFINYFDERTKDLMSTKENIAIPCKPLNMIAEAKTLDIEGFINNTYLDRITFTIKNKIIRLSKRETQCLYNLSSGESIKDISRSLNLSPRTIEFYLNNIKTKTGYKNKEELLKNLIMREYR